MYIHNGLKVYIAVVKRSRDFKFSNDETLCSSMFRSMVVSPMHVHIPTSMGLYYSTRTLNSWHHWQTHYSLKFSEMKLRG